MIRTLILYESKQGITEDIARKLSLILGPARYCETSQFQGNWEDYDFILICAPTYLDAADGEIFHSLPPDVIKKKKVILFTCPTDSMSNSNKNKKFIELALELKKMKDQSDINAPEESLLNKNIDDFIKSHNTCALATGYGGKIRVTPIEYTYMNGFFYMLSEGGEKFANILRNPNVSLCIYNEFKGMNELGGIQITGSAELISIGSDEYISVLKTKGLNINKITSMPISLNMIKITTRKMEFLWSEFSKMGYDVRQILLR